MTPATRQALQRANLLAKGYITVARQAETKEELSDALCKALLAYGVWASDTV